VRADALKGFHWAGFCRAARAIQNARKAARARLAAYIEASGGGLRAFDQVELRFGRTAA